MRTIQLTEEEYKKVNAFLNKNDNRCKHCIFAIRRPVGRCVKYYCGKQETNCMSATGYKSIKASDKACFMFNVIDS